MAMIKCSECGKEISDKAKKCPYCGQVFAEENAVVNIKKCSECGAILAETANECPNCGCPVEEECEQIRDKHQEVEVASKRIRKRTNKIWIGVIIVIIVCVAGGIGFKVYDRQQELKNYNTYIEDLELAQFLMIISGSKAEDLCNLTAQVWNNAIFEESNYKTDEYTKEHGYFVSDFNEALINLFTDEKTLSTIKEIGENQEEIKEIMKRLQDIPDGLERCYDSIMELNTAYSKLTDLAVNPSGTYSSYTSKKSLATSDFMSAFEKLDTQIPDKK